MYAVLFAIFLLYFTRHLYRCLLILIPAALCLVYQSPVVHQGVNDMIRDARNYEQGNQNSSVGHRLQFHNYAQNLFLRSPVWGVGTAAFSYYFSVENPVPSWGTVENGNKLLEPHGEYWLIAAEHGVVGLLVFFLFIIALFYEIFQTKEMRLISIGLLVTFLVGCFSDGFLLLAGPGYLLIMFAALGLGESLAGKQAQLAKRYILNREY